MGEALSPRAAARRWSVWGALLALALLAEFLAFDRFASRHHAWMYPRWNDQIQYLTEAYVGYERVRQEGVVAGLAHAVVNPSAQGTLHDLAAIAVFLVAGPSRSAALSVNLLALVAWQVLLAAAVARRTGSRSLALLGAALPLLLAGPWLVRPGSAFDFRLDHLAMCAFGVVSAAALLADGFRSRRGALALGAAVAGALLTRFLLGAYLAVGAVATIAWLATRPDRRVRLANFALAGLVVVGLAGPLFWINRDWVWNYYVIGHFTGPESALRSPNLGVLESLRFVTRHWAALHAGPWFGAVAAGLVAAAVAARLRAPADAAATAAGRGWLLAGAALALAPALVLVLHAQKSEVVLGVVGPGVILVLLALWRAPAAAGSRLLPVAAAAAALAAAVAFPWQLARARTGEADAREARRLLALADSLHDAARAAGLNRPRIATDEITDFLDGQILRVVCYERRRRWVHFEMTLPTGIAEAPAEVIAARLRDSDFVILTERGSRGQWPYDEQMRRLHPRWRALAEAEFGTPRRLELFGRDLLLFSRPGIPLGTGAAGGAPHIRIAGRAGMPPNSPP